MGMSDFNYASSNDQFEKENFKAFVLVMAGGRGTRFWPESTSKKPKQYLNLLGDKSLLEATLDRFDGLIAKQNRYIVTVKEQASLAGLSRHQINNDGLIFEPAGRNTAPCILLSLAKLVASGANKSDVMAVMPSDHVILNEKGFKEVVASASHIAHKEDKIVTIGVPPNFPHTGYGYIQKGQKLANSNGDVFQVAEFKEKPNYDTAKEYVASGDYLWNAGMFVGTIGRFLAEFEAHSPETFAFFNKLKEAIGSEEELERVYNQIPKDSFDYAVMEKSKNVMVTPALFDWNDLGSWDALEGVIEAKDDNVVVGVKDHYVEESKGNIVYAPDQFVSLINVEDLVVVSNGESLLIMPKSKSQKVKNVVSYLQSSELGEALL
jgi:mannose-1-phosphate guanylyltransferase